MTPNRKQILGIPIDTFEDFFTRALYLHEHGGGQIITLNTEMIMAAREDKQLNIAIKSAELIIPDGQGVVWALKKQGLKITHTPGIDFAYRLLRHSELHHWKVALVGGSPYVLNMVKRRLLQKIPKLKLGMSIHGYQEKDKWPELISSLKESRPDLVLIALGMPLQEIFGKRAKEGCNGLWIGVGGSFDIWAGIKKRAPLWVRIIHLEWLYRLAKEPRRWKRMLVLPKFALAVFNLRRQT